MNEKSARECGRLTGDTCHVPGCHCKYAAQQGLAQGTYRGLQGLQDQVQVATPTKPRIDRLAIERAASGFIVSITTTCGADYSHIAEPRHAVSTFAELLAKVSELFG